MLNLKKKWPKFSDEDTILTKNAFQINTYYVSLDRLILELEKRKQFYNSLLEKYKFFFQLISLSTAEVYKNCQYTSKALSYWSRTLFF